MRPQKGLIVKYYSRQMNKLKKLENYYFAVSSWLSEIERINTVIEPGEIYPIQYLYKTLGFNNSESFFINDTVLDTVLMIQKQGGTAFLKVNETGKTFISGLQLINFICVYACLTRRGTLL